MSTRRTQAERRTQTRADLIAAARAQFAERGYAAVSLEEIVRAAGVTRGALYHHFADKQDLFRTIVREIEQEIDVRMLSTGGAELSGLERFRVAVRVFLEACTQADVGRILLIDGPSVLGWQEWREIDAAPTLRLIEDGLEELAAHDWIAPQPFKPLAHLIYGALIEAGLYLATTSDPEKELPQMHASLEHLLAATLGWRDSNSPSEPHD
ncbi:MAG TPA: TetR/AcrR family transcriptional regulator [Gemmatimonadaceae bacterium]|jgi:AcrR family transcriptional regulator|nr:TetR/AcrR family transcriptional regulator [Gemmatimonadaceae bacterium]